MKRPPILTSLPVELIERIAELTGKQDRISLRMASRECGAKMLNIDKATVFHKVKVQLCSESSIRNAINIIAHPLHGPAVDRIILVDDSEPHPADGEDVAVAAHQAPKNGGAGTDGITKLF